jgi:hypothetical protein
MRNAKNHGANGSLQKKRIIPVIESSKIAFHNAPALTDSIQKG